MNNSEPSSLSAPSPRRRDVAGGGKVTAAPDEPSDRQCCHNVVGAETSGESVEGVCGAGWLCMSEDNGGGVSGFADLTLAPELCHVLSGLGYEEPTPIQLAAIPPLLEGRDLVGQAATGTGKTAAFALPVLQRILTEGRRAEPLALVLVPTRELAVQVSAAMRSYGHDMGARVLPVYGGEPIGRQLGALKRGVDVVVATPGRALDHINRGTLKLSGLEILVLDEADEMLDMGFAEEIEAILASTPGNRQTALFSATMPPRINGMVRRHLREPVRAELGRQASAEAGALLVRQTAYPGPRRPHPRRLGPRPRAEPPRGRDCLLPDQGRGRPAHRVTERPGLSR